MSFRLPQLRIRHRTRLVVSFVVLTSMIACVKESTYEAVQTEIAETRKQLAATKDEMSQLTAQAARLQQTNQEQERNIVELLEALQKEKDAEVLWQKKVREKTDALVARLNAMQGQQRWLARATDHAVKEQATLEAMVAKYKGQLQDSALSPGSVTQPEQRNLDQSASQPATMTSPAPAPPPSLSPPPLLPEPEPVPQAARQKSTPEPEDASWFSTIKGWLGSLWRRIFS